VNIYYCIVRTQDGQEAGIYMEASSNIGVQSKAENIEGVAICIAVQFMSGDIIA
jgi:hypothetical protein